MPALHHWDDPGPEQVARICSVQKEAVLDLRVHPEKSAVWPPSRCSLHGAVAARQRISTLESWAPQYAVELWLGRLTSLRNLIILKPWEPKGRDSVGAAIPSLLGAGRVLSGNRGQCSAAGPDSDGDLSG